MQGDKATKTLVITENEITEKTLWRRDRIIKKHN